jgi:ankyrin repeat protein
VDGYLVTFFVKTFPEEASAVLSADKSNGLIKRIMPYIRDCEPEQLQVLFPSDTGGKREPQVDENGNTALHLAARYGPGTTDDITQAQLKLVKTIYEWCPKALEKVNSKSESPYQYRIQTYFNSPDSKDRRDDIPLRDDIVADFLKDKIMRLSSADLTIRLLHCDGSGV